MTKPKNSVMSNAKGCVMDNLEDLHNWNTEDIMECERVRSMETQSDWCNLMERE